MAIPTPPRPDFGSVRGARPVLPQPTRMIARFPITARAHQVLASSGAPAQMSLFQRPSANDSK